MGQAPRDAEPPRDPELPGRLLLAERDALLPLLRRTPPERYTLRTACPGWTVRDVLAHCAAALVRIVEGRTEDGFGPGTNAADVAERADWPLHRVQEELEYGLTAAGPALAAGDGTWDDVALGEWVHAGDVRDAWGEPGAYGGGDTEAALALLGLASRNRDTPRVHANLPGRTAPLVLGNDTPGRPPAELAADLPALIRLYSGRPLVGTRYTLRGAREDELVMYR
ncbi:maleylpyruvate isomerase family mycothiol-dependent enzyme [Streptomyces gamaensis]|uniref:Maleylpyruvate isomerase family mycothiol-dependent enzyme n=1 Tax=Streptomyces gamaensis TaxID=1763542 RepID=A0ABW0YW83_9ACTN